MTGAPGRTRPLIIDSTLREGNQAPSVLFTASQTAELALAIASVGVDMLECGHPVCGDAELERVRAVTQLDLPVPVLAHARADREDVDAVARSGADWVGIFLGVNEISRRARLGGRSMPELHRMLEDSISHAKGAGLGVRYTVEDASRTPRPELAAAYRIALEAGADRLCFADTVGTLEPREVAEVVAWLRERFDAELEVHLHDDRGLALANALAAADAGVDWISASVNGLGERCGIPDTASLLVNLDYRGGRPLEGRDRLADLSRRVAAYTRSHPDERRPVVGRNAFLHTARLHRVAAEREPRAYEWIEPERVGHERSTPPEPVPRDVSALTFPAKPRSATELVHHREGPGVRYVLLDDSFLPGVDQYCIARRIPAGDPGPGHVDTHAHDCDSLFVFLGDEPGYKGLVAEVEVDGKRIEVSSPCSVFIPAGSEHRYRVVRGSGTYLNHVLAGDYTASLLPPLDLPADGDDYASFGSASRASTDRPVGSAGKP